MFLFKRNPENCISLMNTMKDAYVYFKNQKYHITATVGEILKDNGP